MAREHFHAGEKLCLRWRGPRRIVHAVNDYVYIVEDVRNRALVEAHATRLQYYNDASLDAKAILSHAISSETGMQIQRLLRLVDKPDGIYVAIRWRAFRRQRTLWSRYTKFMPMFRNYYASSSTVKRQQKRSLTRRAVHLAFRQGQCNTPF